VRGARKAAGLEERWPSFRRINLFGSLAFLFERILSKNYEVEFTENSNMKPLWD